MKTLDELVDPLRRLHDWIRDIVVAACEEHSFDHLSDVVHDGAGDVTFRIDRICETELIDRMTADLADDEPIVVVGEGLSDGCITLPAGADPAEAQWRVIVDPIDGTRGLMFQKRSGWILTGVAPNHGPSTLLADIELAVQTEIPLLKQHLSDQLWAIRGLGVNAMRYNRLSGESRPLDVRPSTANDFRNGFATVCRFFPGGRDVLAALDDALCERVLGTMKPGEAPVSSDQYASSGGQLYGLMIGQDLFVADLRPLIAPIVHSRGQAAGHVCHPYDVCTSLIAEEAGIIVTDVHGQPLSAPLDTEAKIAWIGYANPTLRQQIESILHELLREFGLLASV